MGESDRTSFKGIKHFLSWQKFWNNIKFDEILNQKETKE